MGPLIREAQRDRVERYVASGTAEGARLACGGGRPAGLDRGYFFEPTLFADVDSSMAIAQEEIFGPVGVAIPFEDEDDAVRIANDTRYGLAAGIWHPDPLRAFERRPARPGRDRQRSTAGVVDRTCGVRSGATSSRGSGGSSATTGCAEYTQLKTVSWSAGRP